MGRPERRVGKDLLDRCKKRGWTCFKFTAAGLSGVPDRVVIGNGHVVFVETKALGDKPRRLQLEVIAEMRRNGARVEVADSRAKIDQLLADLAADPDQHRDTGVNHGEHLSLIHI